MKIFSRGGQFIWVNLVVNLEKIAAVSVLADICIQADREIVRRRSLMVTTVYLGSEVHKPSYTW
jgi:hypothetical protein